MKHTNSKGQTAEIKDVRMVANLVLGNALELIEELKGMASTSDVEERGAIREFYNNNDIEGAKAQFESAKRTIDNQWSILVCANCKVDFFKYNATIKKGSDHCCEMNCTEQLRLKKKESKNV